MGSTHGFAGLFVSARHFSTLPLPDRPLSGRGEQTREFATPLSRRTLTLWEKNKCLHDLRNN